MKHNWEYKKWENALKIINGKSQKDVENPNGIYPIYGSGGVMNYADAYLCPENCTIIGRKGNINKPIFVRTKFWNVDTAFGLCPFSCIAPRFLYYFCINYDFQKLNKQTTIPSLVKSDLLRIKIPVPPMDVQEQIVTELDKITEIISNCTEVIRNLDALAQSLFYDYFGDPITNPKGWEICKLGDRFETGSGGTPSKTVNEYWENGDIPWIGSNMCQNKIITETDGKLITSLGLENSSAKVLEPNTVLVALVGATIGKAGLLKIQASTNQNIGFIKPNPTIAFPLYLFFVIKNLYSLFTNIGNGKFKMANLSFIRNLPIMLPPLSLQEKFASRIEQIEQQKKDLEDTIANMQTLLDSRMDYWFG